MTDQAATEPADGDSQPLLGREREMRSLGEGLAEAGRGRGSLFLITGEAGIGKTRLADAFRSTARRAGASVVWGRGWEEGGAPAYWPWPQIINGIDREVGPTVVERLSVRQRRHLARIVPEVGDGADPGAEAPLDATDGARFELFAAVMAMLRAAARERPLVIVLDDLHAADEPSLLLLGYVAEMLEEEPLVVLSIFRDEDLELGDARTRLLGRLARLPVTRPIQPRGLDERDVALLIRKTEGATVNDEVAAAIRRETDGNPLFVGEVARMLAEERRFDDPSGAEWRVGPSAGVRAVIGRRLSRLSDGTRSLLARASVLGKEFSLEVFARLEGEPPAALIERFDPAVASRILIGPLPGATWRFSHALVREVLYSSIPASVRLDLHLAAGEALEAIHADDRERYFAELAFHFGRAAPLGSADRAVEYASRAAEQASAALAHEESARLYRMALAVHSTTDAKPDVRVSLLLGLGRAESLSGRVDEAKEAYRQAADLASEHGLTGALAQAAIGYGGRFVWFRAGADIRLVPMLVEALRRLPVTDSPDRVRLLARLAGALRDDTSPERRLAVSAEALAMARRLGDRRSLGYALIGRYTAIMGPDHGEEMASIGRELVDLEASNDDIQTRVAGSFWIDALAFFEGGRERTSLRELAESIDRLVDELRDANLRWTRGVIWTILALLEGRLADAEALIEQTAKAGLLVTPWDAGFAQIVATVGLRREQDRLPEVVDALQAAVPRYLSYPLLGCVLTFVQAATGHEVEASRSMREWVETDFRGLPRDLGWAYGMVHLAEAAILLGDQATSDTVAERLRPFASLHTSASGEVSGGPVSLALGRVAAFRGRIDEALSYLEAAEVAALEIGADLWSVRARVERAAALLQRDDPGDGDAAATILDDCLASCRALGLVALERRIGEIRATAGSGSVHRSRTPIGSGPSAVVEGTWRREGEYWSIRYGAAGFRLRDSKGVRYLADLLSAPGREIHALELAGSTEADPSRVSEAGGRSLDDGLRPDGAGGDDPVLDRQAITAYRARIEDLQEEVDEAESYADPERATRAREELELLVAELSRAMGLGGRARSGISASERARQSVTKAIQGTLRRVREHDPDLAAHLDRSIRTGTFCAYDPDPGVRARWRVAKERLPT
jgi:tetratricopeptide (TPR) repeat protein